ncbi:ABC-three component system middle component 1 [Bradyrhizobium tunisiense]|uniref:ABC-three component system middle component 1 n=1 Tax=Bradyrhizobium tunisiense TaxID=3278709 RepID=UPI0035DC1CC9
MAEAPKFADLLLQAADRIGASVSEAASELIGNNFNSEVLSEVVSRSSIVRHNNDLPKIIHAVRLDDVPVLIGELSGTALRASIEPQLRRYRNQATIARSWLVSEAPNLQMVLIGPLGAYSKSEWRQLAAEIEADDRTCRKLVWLFDQVPDLDEAETFLARTFVARPWPATQQRVLLDTVASYSLPPGWEEAVDDKDLDFDGLVEKLIELEAKT